jgi:hypothetical protein
VNPCIQFSVAPDSFIATIELARRFDPKHIRQEVSGLVCVELPQPHCRGFHSRRVCAQLFFIFVSFSVFEFTSFDLQRIRRVSRAFQLVQRFICSSFGFVLVQPSFLSQRPSYIHIFQVSLQHLGFCVVFWIDSRAFARPHFACSLLCFELLWAAPLLPGRLKSPRTMTGARL